MSSITPSTPSPIPTSPINAQREQLAAEITAQYAPELLARVQQQHWQLKQQIYESTHRRIKTSVASQSAECKANFFSYDW